ncbi:MAG: ABC transporter substrate-binding protein [Balneola sp.]|nr:MAG: ABC transporter substrate-binding protein [Balneola sp.]
MKVCSFLPAATQMMYDMKLDGMLEGITFECPEQALSEKPPVVRCVLEGKNYSSIEIDKIFSASKASGKSLYYVDEELIQEIAPDVIFTQDVCDVCQIDTECTSRAVAKLPKQPELISLTPQSLHDVFDNALTIAKAVGQEEVAYQYLGGLQQRIDLIIDTLRKHKTLPRRVSLLEWIDPIYNCGHWIPHQIGYAGGVDMLSNPSSDSIRMEWERIAKYDPEVLVIAPCGFNIERAAEEIDILVNKKGWDQVSAVRNGEVYLVDFDLFTQSSAGTLVDGIEVLASLFHPEIFNLPKRISHKAKAIELIKLGIK